MLLVLESTRKKPVCVESYVNNRPCARVIVGVDVAIRGDVGCLIIVFALFSIMNTLGRYYLPAHKTSIFQHRL